ncbi:chemotaxis protein CheW [Deltaproteobacteria bacterium OttesenSCG-928-M10]|nr:chemotaxis protein CheW [Deltaproteobacteria bacterium OttesenSCG-928-M10]
MSSDSSSQSIASKGRAASQEGKFLTFSLAGEEYGISILKVREIIGMMPIRTVPQTPGFVKGVINLRGKVIPVMSLRLKFGMEEVDYTEKTSIIVVDVSSAAEKMIHIGIVVDFVSEVINVRSSDVEPAPAFGDTLNTDYILGLAKINSSVKILLDIDRVLSVEELGGLTMDF